MSIVTTEELREYMSGVGLDADQAGGAQDILDGLQRELERYCQRPLERMVRTEQVVPDEYGRLWLKATPIHAVTSPTGLWPDGNMVGGTHHFLQWGFGWLEPVTVTYEGGVDGEDEADIRLAILRIAAREMATRHDDTLTVRDLSTTSPPLQDRRDIGWQPEELAKFDRLRRRTVV